MKAEASGHDEGPQVGPEKTEQTRDILHINYILCLHHKKVADRTFCLHRKNVIIVSSMHPKIAQLFLNCLVL